MPTRRHLSCCAFLLFLTLPCCPVRAVDCNLMDISLQIALFSFLRGGVKHFKALRPCFLGRRFTAVSGRGGHSARCNQGAPRAALEACHHMCPSLSPYAPRERAEGSRQHGQRSLARAVARALARALVSHVPSGFRRAVGGRPALIGVRRLCYTEKDENVK